MQKVRSEIVSEYIAAGLNKNIAYDLADNNLLSSKTVPVKRVIPSSESLYKFVPANKEPGRSSYYFTESEYKYFKQNPQKMPFKAGLPYKNFVGEYDVYMIKPKSNKSPIVFESRVAEVKQGSYNTTGGAIQTIVPNLNVWTNPIVIDSLKVY